MPYASQAEVPEAGCDEAGRGCLAGPVVAAAVILPPGFAHPLIRDSKRLSERQRNEAATVIRENAVAWGVGICSPEEIDRINILNASIEAMHRALQALEPQPQFIVVDGNRFKPYGSVPYKTVVRGDATLGNIAAASIIAKTTRDAIMADLHRQYPFYGWDRNKGYPTEEHRRGIAEHGRCEHHRMTFAVELPSLFDE